MQGCSIIRLHTDHPGLRVEIFDIGRHPGNQTAPPYRDEDRIDLSRVLAQNLHRNGALSCNHLRVVIGVYQRHPRLFRQRCRMLVGIIIGITKQHRLRPIFAYRLHLDLGCGLGHYDGRLDPHLPRGEGHPLGMISCRRSDHSLLQLGLAQARHLVVGPTQLE